MVFLLMISKISYCDEQNSCSIKKRKTSFSWKIMKDIWSLHNFIGKLLITNGSLQCGRKGSKHFFLWWWDVIWTNVAAELDMPLTSSPQNSLLPFHWFSGIKMGTLVKCGIMQLLTIGMLSPKTQIFKFNYFQWSRWGLWLKEELTEELQESTQQIWLAGVVLINPFSENKTALPTQYL